MIDAPDDKVTSYRLPAIEGSIVGEAKANSVRDKSSAFALDMIKIHRSHVRVHEYEISRRLMRS
jgi:hypothetical protein